MVVTATRMSAAEFLSLPETNLPTELLDGEIIMAPAPTLDHQDVVLNLAATLLKLKSGGKVVISPVDVELDDENVVQPDVMWVSPGSKCVPVQKKNYRGAPDLAAEVFSPGTARIDKSKKFKLYEKYGTREYWMADPEGQYIEVWRLEGERFSQVGVFGPGETFVSTVLDEQTVSVSDIFAAQS